ncbi:hypothetical protein ASG89_27930 [Paenibacillus sp. Soil766]|uniref:nucleotidyltransferase family protein n=1 Tax=Paenibacillus sp. Soil766 TaxID=1736404 RepID=UPI00070A5F74|nr:nucleotidyltransferase family protein [Paenibacillus sp. Soil766]KRE99392.1 hypothetical protein ASG89_27930 [Paenibacillus sp. Soil766]
MEAIVLAAGYSSRANDFKMSLQLGSMTVLEHTVSKFEGICKRVIVVSGFQCDRITVATSEMQKKHKFDMDIVCVVNPNFDQGMFSSIQRGCIEVEASSLFITPGDCPLVQKETIWHVAKEKGKVVIPSYQMRGGHPIKLVDEIRTRILEAKANSNLRKILEGYEKNYVNVEDPGVLMDLDTPEDYKRATEYYNEYSRKR